MNILEPEHYVVYYLNGCPFSEGAVKLLDKKELSYKIVNMEMNELKKKYGQEATFPRIYLGDDLVGGFDDLQIKLNN